MVGFLSKGLTTAFISVMRAFLARDMSFAMATPGIPGGKTGFRKRSRGRGRKMMKNPPNRTGWFRRHASMWHPPITERMLTRHGWYRRQLRKKGIAIEPNQKNSMVLR